MKKVGAVFLILTIILGGFMPIISHANSQLDKDLEEAIIKVKELFQISNDYDGFTQRVNLNNDQISFYMNWTDSKNILPSINVNTDPKGFITSYNKYYSQQEEKDKNASITKVEGEKKALEFIKKVSPEIIENIKVIQNNSPLYLGDDYYNFEFYRVENNIPFYNNTISVSINKFTGEVNNYNVNWDKKLSFPNPNQAISVDKAKQAFKDEIGLHLIYKTSYGIYKMSYPRELNYFLSYSTLNNNKAIDAFTGKAINLSSNRLYAAENQKSEMASDSQLTPFEKAEIDKLIGIKNITDVEKISRDILALDESYKLANKNLFTSWNNPDEYLWMLQFTKTIDNDNILYASIDLNAKTGGLISFSKNEKQDPLAKSNINKEQALQLTKDYLNKNIGDKQNQLEYILDETLDGELNYNFKFRRKTDGIYIENDEINIGIDTVNKKVISYSLRWYNGEMPSKNNIISLNRAYEILFNNISYELRYTTIYKPEELGKNKEEVKLVYALKTDNPIIIDSYNGDFLDHEGKKYGENKIVEYVDIDNSYARDKIKKLSEFGISFKETKFKPGEKMKQSEFLYLLWKSQNNTIIEYNDSMDQMYKDLKSLNIVRVGDRDKDTAITKEEAARYIIRTMNYDKLADESYIFKALWNDETDISKGLVGYLNIAYGLKIINGDGKTNNINPKYELKREDGANIIYNYLFMN